MRSALVPRYRASRKRHPATQAMAMISIPRSNTSNSVPVYGPGTRRRVSTCHVPGDGASRSLAGRLKRRRRMTSAKSAAGKAATSSEDGQPRNAAARTGRMAPFYPSRTALLRYCASASDPVDDAPKSSGELSPSRGRSLPLQLGHDRLGRHALSAVRHECRLENAARDQQVHRVHASAI